MIPFSRPADWQCQSGACHELGHTWHPSCVYCAVELFAHVFSGALKIYLPLYLVNDDDVIIIGNNLRFYQLSVAV